MSEIEFLGALHVELLRHAELHAERPAHELFQTSTVQALLGGAYDGDVTLAEVLEHGDLGLGTLDGLDGELIVLGGEAWKAQLDCTLVRVDGEAKTPYAVVVPFSPGEPQALLGPFGEAELEARLGEAVTGASRPTAVRLDGRFAEVHVRSVPRQSPPYRPLAEVISQQQISVLKDVVGTMVGFCFPDALDGIEMAGAHLHFLSDDRTRGGHVLSYTLLQAVARLDAASGLHVELPAAVAPPRHGASVDEGALQQIEHDR
ncbi:MAG TPA: acetolactate decarboxylase [Solirubrobacteraceae bacterium]|jgi:acetolactate decarboxylase|nr:acetolactate decarboxylase [Solirubrobacteraceae bacterium]